MWGSWSTNFVPQAQGDIVIPPTPTFINVPDSIARTYYRGALSEDIRATQKLLNQTACRVALHGPGSSGQETIYFGPLTQQALVCYQRVKGFSMTGILTPDLYGYLLRDYLGILSAFISTLVNVLASLSVLV